MSVISIYLPIFGILFLVLSIRAALTRRRLQIAVGDDGNIEMKRAMRVHANFIEYVPISVLLIYFLEQATGGVVWAHVLCLALVVGRVSHAYGVSQVKENLRFRVAGMALTFFVIASASVRLAIANF